MRSKIKSLILAVSLVSLFITNPAHASVEVFNLSTGSINTTTNTVTTSDTAINFTVGSSSSCAQSETAIFAFDSNVNSKYCYDSSPFSSNAITLHYLNAEVNPLLLTLTTANDSATWSERNPLRWKLYGSNDGTNWALIRDNTYFDFLVPTTNVTDYDYDSFLDYTGYHSYLKFEIVSLLGDTNTTQFSELKIMGNFNLVPTCAFKGNSSTARNSIGQSKSNSPAPTRSNGAGACQNASSR